MDPVKRAREALNEALRAYQAAAEAIETAAEDADLEPLERSFDEAKAAYEARQKDLERAEKLAEVRGLSPVPVPDEKPEERGTGRIEVGNEEQVYRPDVQRSFFRDMLFARRNPLEHVDAVERMQRHAAMNRVVEQRAPADNSTTATDGGGFVPPQYLQQLYSPLARPGRPFANVVPKLPLPPVGMTMSMPRVTTGVSVAAQATENSALSSTAIVEAVDTYYVRTCGGVLDLSMQLFDRSEPSIDTVIMRDLTGAYDAKLDTWLLSGAAASSEHVGLRNVTGNIDVTYSDSSPTGAEALPKIYDASQQIMSNRYLPANLIVMHPRRAAFFAAASSSSAPILQQGGLMQAFGTQDNTFAGTIAGLPVLLDPNIATTYSQSGSTNEDEIYVLHLNDLYLAEGPFRTDVFMEPGSETLTVRFRGFAYSCFISGRYPKSIAVIAGGGLATPSF